jgi:hypothetical protein
MMDVLTVVLTSSVSLTQQLQDVPLLLYQDLVSVCKTAEIDPRFSE